MGNRTILLRSEDVRFRCVKNMCKELEDASRYSFITNLVGGKKSEIAKEREKERERDIALAIGDKDRHNEKMRRVKTHKEEEREGME